MGLILYLIIGGVIGWFAGIILGKNMPGGVIGNVVSGIIGAWIGGRLLGNWGPKLADFYVVPAIIGAVIFVIILSFVMKSMPKKW
ncbi:GlsB/YeaQ/YmgE family stress response membrane protein [Sporosarcina sp. Marseille-Q4063]|uniref:GlsB/YeaQ/YmgE family stress response membrane protein n=1 Tax=Sporosarcina sp. Marseille-Q4063 TaxID=2810514 RepID=UPI001BAEA220|nr:GlsB/YeaQ/YmgE family stress response membrane protein [Sporosarcina sp. Marseille-Q4063]QUW20291.1 GlsB/YeaQ/YmgE family stress response membrane protein [Sporosarcina sp. Marseille-Q4063]